MNMPDSGTAAWEMMRPDGGETPPLHFAALVLARKSAYAHRRFGPRVLGALGLVVAGER
jgi:hypothetical protein